MKELVNTAKATDFTAYTKQELFERSSHSSKQIGFAAFTENELLVSNPYSIKDNSKEVQIKHFAWAHGWYEAFIALKSLLENHIKTIGEDPWVCKTKEYLKNVLIANNIKSESCLIQSNKSFSAIFTLNT